MPCSLGLPNLRNRPNAGLAASVSNVSKAASTTRDAAFGLSSAMKRQMDHSSSSTHGSSKILGIRSGLFYSFAQAAQYFFVIDSPALFQPINSFQQMRFEFFNRPGCRRQPGNLIFFQPAQAGANNFTRGMIKAAFNFLFHKFFQLWSQ